MKHCLYILLLLIVSATTVQAQRGASRADQKGGGKRGGFSLSNLTSSQKDIPDSLLVADSAALNSKRITAYRLTPSLGEAYVAPLDTNKLNFSNSTLVESKSLAIGYLANLGAPAQTKIFSERQEARRCLRLLYHNAGKRLFLQHKDSLYQRSVHHRRR